jgi:hypothetical protein
LVFGLDLLKSPLEPRLQRRRWWLRWVASRACGTKSTARPIPLSSPNPPVLLPYPHLLPVPCFPVLHTHFLVLLPILLVLAGLLLASLLPVRLYPARLLDLCSPISFPLVLWVFHHFCATSLRCW